MTHWFPIPPEPYHLLREFSTLGFRFRSAGYAEALLSEIPHDVASRRDIVGVNLPRELLDCAEACLYMFPARSASYNENEFRSDADANIRIGPRQREFLSLLSSYGFNALVLSAYRSPFYQSLLFGAKYLDGTLFDDQGRYFCLPPKFSDHVNADSALDIENSIGLTFALSTIDSELPCSVFRPFICNKHVAFEPWHWRTMFGGLAFKGSATGHHFPTTRNRVITDDILEHFDPSHRSDKSRNKLTPAAHVFSHGYNRSGGARCVGSLRQTISLSISDAAAASGEWPHRIVTIPHGFTPLMDGTILPLDVGSCVFRIITTEKNSPSYLTPTACIFESINTPPRIIVELEKKARISPGQSYFLEKSLTDEWLQYDDGTVLQIEYGNPRSGYYRFEDAPVILFCRFETWLVASSRGDVPPYVMYPPHFQPMYEINFVHHALLLSYLSEFCLEDSRFSDLRYSLTGIIDKRISEIDCDVEAVERSYLIASVVFYIRSLLFESRDVVVSVFEKWWPKIKQYVEDNRNNKESRLLIGHVCSILRIIYSKGLSCIFDLSVVPKSGEVILWLDEDPIYTLAASQVIALRAALGDEPDGELAYKFLIKVVRWPSGVGLGELGSFAGLETFQSSLPIEAIAEIAPLVNLSEDERSKVIHRSLEAVAFLARCQFDEGTGLLSSKHEDLVGAVPYSLIDKHVRVDYGVHASRAARFIAKYMVGEPQ